MKKKLLSILLSLTLVVTMMPAMTMTAFATGYTNRRWDLTLSDSGKLTEAKYTFKAIDEAAGAFHLYIWKLGDTTGDQNRPTIIREASETHTAGTKQAYRDYTLTLSDLDLTVDENNTYAVGMALKGSKWSTGNTLDEKHKIWPYIASACDFESSDDTLTGDVYVNGKKIDSSLKTKAMMKTVEHHDENQQIA